jgi:hypothetical protein
VQYRLFDVISNVQSWKTHIDIMGRASYYFGSRESKRVLWSDLDEDELRSINRKSGFFSEEDTIFPDFKGGVYHNVIHVKPASVVVRDVDYDVEGQSVVTFGPWFDPEDFAYYNVLRREGNLFAIISVTPTWTYSFARDYYRPAYQYALYELLENGVVLLHSRYWDGWTSNTRRDHPFLWAGGRDARTLSLKWLKDEFSNEVRAVGHMASSHWYSLPQTPDLLLRDMQFHKDAYRDVEDQLGFNAYSSLKLVDAPLLREMADTVFSLGTISESAKLSSFTETPREFIGSLRSLLANRSTLKQNLKNLMVAARGSSDGVVSRGEIDKLLNGKIHKRSVKLTKDAARAAASTQLWWDFGVSLPGQTLRDWLEPGALYSDALTAGLSLNQEARKKATERITKLFGDSALRASSTYTLCGDRTRCSLNLGITTWGDWRDTVNAFYRAGLLLDFADIWDLLPDSFVVDWVTSAFKRSVEQIDYRLNLNRFNMTYVCRSVKYRKRIPVTYLGHRSEQWFDVYCRWYNSTQPATRRMISVLNCEDEFWRGKFSFQSAPDAASLVISFLT